MPRLALPLRLEGKNRLAARHRRTLKLTENIALTSRWARKNNHKQANNETIYEIIIVLAGFAAFARHDMGSRS